jgi:cytochrome c556
MIKAIIVASMAIFTIFIGAAKSNAAESPLKEIMRELGSVVASLSTAIALEDYAAIETNASEIASHEMPDMETRMKIMSFLGERSVAFRGADEKTHLAAAMMAEAAKRKDMDVVLEAYSDMLSGCVECHTNFRADVRKLFGKEGN